ncbi:hypothetical protein MQB33_003530 [Salmonella enterica subsp. enterica serovar Sandiego]|nr:hypothetical protein [Salmonella enterica subsp. enterica serovar Sandiego]
MESLQHIYVINPNSLHSVTREIEHALSPLQFPGGPVIKCVTLAKGPAGIQTQRDVDSVAIPLCEQIIRCTAQSNAQGAIASAFIIACFSDPGLYSARECTDKQVFGIAESGILTAMAMGQKFGVISILQTSIARHFRYFTAMGVTGRFAGDIAIGLSVDGLSDRDETFKRLNVAGAALRDKHSADVLVLGCAGMASYRKMLEETLDIPVVDPTQAAVTMALGQIACRSNNG